MLKANRNALERVNPGIAAQVDRVIGTACAVPMHALDSPEAEARNWAAQTDHRADTWVIVGIGRGHHIRALMRHARKLQRFLVVEPSPAAFRCAVDSVDLSDIILRPHTHLWIGPDPTPFGHWLHTHFCDAETQRLAIWLWPPAVRNHPQAYLAITREIQAIAHRQRVELVTLMACGRDLEANAIANVAALPRSARPQDFADKLKGVPGVVVAAGPSATTQMDALKAAQGQCAIVCVSKSIALLRGHGIEPHFAASLDMKEVSAEHLRGLDCRDIILAYDADCHPATPVRWSGRLITGDSGVPIMRRAMGFAGGFAPLPKGLSVAHTAFHIAHMLGCDPIILVGVDLALPGDRTHADGVSMTWGGNKATWQGKKKHQLVNIPCVSGGMVQTLWTFASYVTVFEDEINAAGRTVINTSPNGALIRGCKHKSLAQAMNTKPAHPVTHIVNDAWRARQKCAAADMLAGLGAIEADIEEMRRVCDRAAASVKQLKYLDPANRDDKRKLGRLAQQWHKARKQVSDSVAADVLNRCVARTALQLRDMAWAALDKKTDAEKREHEAEYLRAFFTGYSDAAQFYLPHLRKTMRELANAKP